MSQQPQQSPIAPETGPAARGAQPTIGELVARISENVSGLVQGEIDLAKAKGKRMATSMGVGAGLLAAAGVLALYAFGMLLDAAAHGIGEALPLWAGYLIVGLILLVIVAALAIAGKQQLDEGKKNTPAPQAGLKEDVATLKGAVASGLEKGKQQ